MKIRIRRLLFTGVALVLSLIMTDVLADRTSIEEQASRITHKYLLTDTHIDVPYRLHSGWVDVTSSAPDGEFDYPRAVQGGLNLPFMSIYTPAEMEKEGGSYELANQLIDSVEAIAARAPDKFMLVYSVADVEKSMESGRIGLAMGMENGSPIDHKIENVQFFADRGIRYITLTHGLSNQISDSSYDENHHLGRFESVWQRGDRRDEPGWHHGGYFARVRRCILADIGGHKGAGDRLALIRTSLHAWFRTQHE